MTKNIRLPVDMSLALYKRIKARAAQKEMSMAAHARMVLTADVDAADAAALGV